MFDFLRSVCSDKGGTIMNSLNLIAIRLMSGFVLVCALFGMGAFSSGSAAEDEDVAPGGAIESYGAVSGLLAPGAVDLPKPSKNLPYFFPTDNDATATVMYLLNTDTVEHVVELRGYSYDGVLVYSLNITIPATSMRRLSSDSLVTSPPPSWTASSDPTSDPRPGPIITSFTDFTYYAKHIPAERSERGWLRAIQPRDGG